MVNEKNNKKYNLDYKINDFAERYYNDNKKNSGIDVKKKEAIDEIKSLINNIASWYIEKYPSTIMIEHIFGEAGDTKKEDRKDFDAYIKSLPEPERFFLSDQHYRDSISFSLAGLYCSIFGVKDNKIESCPDIKDKTNKNYKDIIIGKEVEEAYQILNNNKRDFRRLSLTTMKEMISEMKYLRDVRNGILTCVMYRLIQARKSTVDSFRTLLFAKSFDLDLSIPAIYGYDMADDDTVVFLAKCVDDGVSADTMVINGYSDTKNDMYLVGTIGQILSMPHRGDKRPCGFQYELSSFNNKN